MENISKEQMELTAENVYKVFKNCLYQKKEIQDEKFADECIHVSGIVNDFIFHPERLMAEKDHIEQMLSDLPDEFKHGWTFLNLCQTKSGKQWTDLHQTMEILMALGIAIGKIAYCCPREYWEVLPGGVPYIVLKL